MKTCELCGKEFEPNGNWQKYCSPKCRARAHYLGRNFSKKITLYTIVGPNGERFETDSMQAFVRAHPERFLNFQSAYSSLLKSGKYGGWYIESQEAKKREGNILSPGAGVERTCAYCGKIFVSMNGHIKHCSSECAKASLEQAERERIKRRGQAKPPVMRVCVQCGKEFAQEGQRRKYCSEACAEAEQKARTTREVRTCAQCGKEFVQEGRRRKYCSEACAEAAREAWASARVAQTASRACARCGKEFIAGNPRRKYCNSECQKKAATQKQIEAHRRAADAAKTNIERVCPICGETFITTNRNIKYCSGECRRKQSVIRTAARQREKRERMRGTSERAYRLRSPDGNIYEMKFMTRFIREHPEWFPNAQSAYVNLRYPGKYKGWEAIGVMREREKIDE